MEVRSDQASVMSILLYGCTTWTLTKRMEKKLDGNYRRMLQAILNKSWRQHPTPQSSGCMATYYPSQKLSKLDEPDMQDTTGKVVTYSCGALHMAKQRQDDQLKPTYSSSMPIQDVALKTGRKQWMIEKGGKRGSGISVLMAQHDDGIKCLEEIY